jgi:exopolysaccharide biosynthesis polyprenyl glycosylphosphotransferase
MRVALKWVRLRGRNLRFLLIVGSNARAVQFAKKIVSNPGLGYRLLGFVDDEWSGLEALREEGYPLACDFEGMRVFIRENVVDEVVMALPMRSLHAHASQVAEICEEHGIPLRLTSNLFDLKTARSRTEDFEGDSVVTHYTGALVGWPMVIKRIFDFVVSLVLIILLAPALLITAILVKLTSPGPVLFFQKRLGLNKRRFSICKFRTMVPDAEKRMNEIEHLNEVSGPVFKIKNDPRITPVGRFLRKTSIDELPQLFNVLKGDMSLVGPRPLPVRDYEGFNEDWQRRRFSVRPGITCLWQVGGRSSIAFEKWMALDLEYIDRWSLWLDFQILLRTIPAILKGSGAA